MSRDMQLHDKDLISEMGSTSNVSQDIGLLEFPHLVVDPSGRRLQSPSASPTGHAWPNTQWSMLGKKSMKLTGAQKKKGVDPSIGVLQS